jgi:hypothetical protein
MESGNNNNKYNNNNNNNNGKYIITPQRMEQRSDNGAPVDINTPWVMRLNHITTGADGLPKIGCEVISSALTKLKNDASLPCVHL